jgi:hypothetical protein
MSELKFAFEILIVGALALPWLLVLIHAFSPAHAFLQPDQQFKTLISRVGDNTQQAVIAAFVIAIGYLLGSAVSRISRNFFNDELPGIEHLEDRIRENVYWNEYCEAALLHYSHYPKVPSTFPLHTQMVHWMCTGVQNSENPRFKQDVQEMFRLQEGELLLNGQDKVDRLRQYYDQIAVLRGAALNGVVLFTVSLFGFFGNLRERASKQRIKKILTFFPAGILVIYAGYSLYSYSQRWELGAETFEPVFPPFELIQAETPCIESSQTEMRCVDAPPAKNRQLHRTRAEYFYVHPPLAEFVLLVLGLVGFFVTLKARRASFYLPTALIAAVLTSISFGAWWWTEVMYDLHVVDSVPELGAAPPKTGSRMQVPGLILPSLAIPSEAHLPNEKFWLVS